MVTNWNSTSAVISTSEMKIGRGLGFNSWKGVVKSKFPCINRRIIWRIVTDL